MQRLLQLLTYRRGCRRTGLHRLRRLRQRWLKVHGPPGSSAVRGVAGIPGGSGQSFGIGYRRRIGEAFFSSPDAGSLDHVEVVVDQFLPLTAVHRQELGRLAERFQLVPHGLSTNIGSPSGPDETYLEGVRQVLRLTKAQVFTDHLAVTGSARHSLGHLSPVVRTAESLQWTTANLRRVAALLDVPVAVETITEPFDVPGSTMSSSEFASAAAEASGTTLLLDVTNVLINSHNRGLDPRSEIERYPSELVSHVHLAGYEQAGPTLIDTHSAPVPLDVIELLGAHLARTSRTATVTIERDANIPSFEDLICEVDGLRRRFQSSA